MPTSIQFLLFGWWNFSRYFLFRFTVDSTVLSTRIETKKLTDCSYLSQENAKHYVQILHFVFPIGELAGPIIVSPFLRDDKNFTIEYSPAERAAIANRTADEGFFERLFDVTKTSNLWIPYMGISSLKITIGILVFIAYMVKVIGWFLVKAFETEIDLKLI